MSDLSSSIAFNSAVLPGLYTYSTLPPANINQAKYAFVTDLGGGPDMVLSDGTNWKHIRRGQASTISAASTVTITPLASPTIMVVSGALTIAMNFNLLTTNIYTGYEFTLVRPGALGIGGGLGISLNGGSTLFNQLGSSWADYTYNGTTLQMIRGSSIL